MCLAFGVERLDELGDKVSSVLEMQPPQGVGDKLRALGKLKSLADSRAAHRLERPLPGARARPARSRPAPDRHLLARRRRPVHHAALGLHEGSAHGRAQRRHVPPAEARRGLHGAALADPQGRRGRLARGRRPHGGRGLDRQRPDHGLRRLVSRPEARRRADGRRLPARQGRRRRAVQDGRPAGARARRDRAGGLLRARRARRRGAVRRPHRLLHARRAVPGAAPDVHDDAPRRHLPEHPGRPSAGRGRLAGQGHRAAVPAGAARDAARARRLRPARRRRVPQLLHRLDPQGLPGPRAQGHARRLGHRAALADQDGHRRRRVGRTCTTTRRWPGRSAPTSIRGATSSRREGRSTSSITPPRCSRWAASSGSMRRRRGPARATRANGPRSPA